MGVFRSPRTSQPRDGRSRVVGGAGCDDGQARFPTDFMFQLTRDEYALLRSQIATLKAGRGQIGPRSYCPALGFMLQLDAHELRNLKSHFATSSSLGTAPQAAPTFLHEPTAERCHIPPGHPVSQACASRSSRRPGESAGKPSSSPLPPAL